MRITTTPRRSTTAPIPSLLLVALLGCGRPSSTPSPVPPLPAVQVWGSLRELMHGASTEARVAIAPLLDTPHFYAVGALAGMRGEVTIVDGVVWLAFGDRDAGRATVGATDEGAALLVGSRVNDWTRVAINEDIAFAQIDQRIEELAAAARIDTEQPFPFLIGIKLADVRWHVLKGPPPAGAAPHDHTANAAVGERAAMDGTLVGFFSKHHHGAFTHTGQNVHAHLVNSSLQIAAHADAFTIRAGSAIAFPRRDLPRDPPRQ